MIDVNKLKVGVTFADEGSPWKVMKYDFIKMGRGGAVIKVKAKNLVSGSIVTKSFQSGNVVEDISLEKKHRNSVSNLTKPVKVASGLTIMVPLFIKRGEKIKFFGVEGRR